MPSLKLSNPFRRNTARPSLRERAATLKATAGRVLRPKAPPMSATEPKADEADRAALLARLLAFYAEERASRPIEEDEHNTVPFRAAELVQRRLWALAREVLALPSPQTRDGLALAALAAAILVEGDCRDLRDPTDCAVAGLTRAALAFTGLGEPPGYTGFGYEADHLARDRTVCSGAGSIPAWAVAEIEAEDRAASEAPAAGEAAASRLGTAAPERDEEGERGGELPSAATAPDAAPAHDLSGCTLPQLARLYETWEGVFRHVTAATAIPCFGDDSDSGLNAAGLILDVEYDRAGILLGAIADEVQRRVPKCGRDRTERAGVLARNEMNTNGAIDVAVLASLVSSAEG